VAGSFLPIAMEDHDGAYFFWKSAGLTDATVLHFDAHLDVGDDGFPGDLLQRILACRDVNELSRFRADQATSWIGIHPGNYLYPALKDGTASRLIWVVPPHLPFPEAAQNGREPTGTDPFLAWIREELQKWVCLGLDEYRSLAAAKGIISGHLVKRPLFVCTHEHLPELPAALLVDIDLDYFIDQQDLIWITARRFLGRLARAAPRINALTMAYSISGGYMPTEHRYVGDLLLMMAPAYWGEAGGNWPPPSADLLDAWDRVQREILDADRDRVNGNPARALDAYSNLLAWTVSRLGIEWIAPARSPLDFRPGGMKIQAIGTPAERRVLDRQLNEVKTGPAGNPFLPALYHKIALCRHLQKEPSLAREYSDRAVVLDPRYHTTFLDQAMVALRRNRYQEARDRLESAFAEPGAELMIPFIGALSFIMEGEVARARPRWEELLGQEHLGAWERAFLANVLGRALQERGQFPESIELLGRVVELDPTHAQAAMMLGLALYQAGKPDQAMPVLRRAINLAPDRIFTPRARLALGEIYRQKGMRGLAMIELEKVRRDDPGGVLAIKAMLRMV